MSSEWAGVDGGGSVAPSMSGTGQQGVGAAPRWWNPLDSIAIDARIAAGGLWAWRAQAVDNITWGAGPANYAVSLTSVEGNSVTLGEIGGGSVNWAAANGWSGFLALARCLDTGVNPTTGFAVFVQIADGPSGGLRYVIGEFDGALARLLGIAPEPTRITWVAGSVVQVAPVINSGNVAIIGNQAYRNSIADGLPMAGLAGLAGNSLYIGARNDAPGAPFGYANMSIQAVLIIDDGTAVTAADRAAIAASGTGSMQNL